MLKSYKIYTCTNGALGLHLSRAPWDPYPWVSSIQKDSTSYRAGLRTGDCLLELNGQDVLGMKISEIAALLKNHWLNESSNYVTVVIWRNKHNRNSNNDCNEAVNNENDDNDDDDEDEENNAHNINQQSLQKFATCLQHIAQLLECPVCLEVIKPPGWQCCNGHVLCNNCRSRSEKCPVCRVPLGPRGRCLLSDKLFTLLADSFPCDGVRSNKNSPKDRRKCSTEFHNQPKMAIVQKQQHQQQQQQNEKDEQYGAKKAKDFLFSSLRYRRRKISSYKTYHDDEGQPGEMKEENKHSSRQKEAMYDTNSIVVVDSGMNGNTSNHKTSLDYNSGGAFIDEQPASDVNVEGVATTFRFNKLQGQTSTIQQCHCITCFKLDKVAIVNNVTAAATATATTKTAVNKYLLQIPSQGHLVNIVQQQQQEYKEKYKNYQCPTGKLCCLNVNVMSSVTCAGVGAGKNATENYNNESVTNTNINTAFCEPTTKNILSTTTTKTVKIKQTAFMTAQQHQVNDYKLIKILKNEWDILAHLTEDHQLPVSQYYAEYGQRILVQQNSAQQRSIACLNLRGTDENDVNVEKFFLACIPLEMSSTTTVSKVAVFMYHMNTLENDTTTITSITSTSTTSLTDEVSNFETIIENPLTGIKWFGRAHPLTTPWFDIYEKQHFLQHNVLQKHSVAISQSVNATAVSSDDDVFVVVVNRA